MDAETAQARAPRHGGLSVPGIFLTKDVPGHAYKILPGALLLRKDPSVHFDTLASRPRPCAVVMLALYLSVLGVPFVFAGT